MKFIVSLFTTFAAVLAAGVAFAEGDAETATAVATTTSNWGIFAPALLMTVAAAMGTFSQSRAAVAALEGIARNPQAASKVQTPLILSLAFMESLVLFALLAFFIMPK